MKNILWATENAERLQRGELLSEREDDDYREEVFGRQLS